ncbi:MAG: hypothetical protein NVS9B8_17550 [Candidatus Limnocylindrales bacterium]
MTADMLYTEARSGTAGPRRDTMIDAAERGRSHDTAPGDSQAGSSDIGAWAQSLAGLIGRELPTEHVAVFVPDADGAGLRLVAQVWGAGEDTGEVVVGRWIVPLDGSICGHVFRTGRATLCADVAMDPDYRSFPGGHTRSSLTVPIGPPDDVVGVINVEAPWVAAFSIRDYERLTARAAAAFESYPRRSN